MKRLLPAVAILAFLVLPQAAQAQAEYYDQIQLRKVKEIYVDVQTAPLFDAAIVEKGCLTSQDALKVEAEQILRNSGITVTDELKRENHFLLIEPLGSSVSNSSDTCFGNIRVSLIQEETLSDGTVGQVGLAYYGTPLIGSKSGFEELLRDYVNRATTILALKILQARLQ